MHDARTGEMRLLALSLLTAALLSAQHAHHASAGKPVAMLDGLGSVHHPIQSTNSDTQKFFEQGLALAFGFNHDEAFRAFKQAHELDPKAAMPLWGMAMVIGPNYNMERDPAREAEAFGYAKKALELATDEQERMYAQAMLRRYTLEKNIDGKKLNTDYAMAMREVAMKYPDDLDAATLYAESLMNLNPWKLWSADFKPGEHTEEIVLVLESVLRRAPEHIGANHYYIHAVEASGHPERALPSANRLGKLAPKSGHLVHMPGHIYIQTGDYNDMVESNIAAVEADRQMIERTGAQGVYPLMYYTHNMHFVAVGEAARGRYKEALAMARKMTENVKPGLAGMQMLEGFTLLEPMVMLRFHRWDELIQAKPVNDSAMLRGFYHYARGTAYAAKHQTKEAERELAELERTIPQMDKQAFTMLASAQQMSQIEVLSLKAAIAEASDEHAKAADFWREAIRLQDALPYEEPAQWHYSIRQSLGAALLRAGKAAQAEEVFRDALRKHPRDGRLLYGLLESLKAQKKSGAVWVEAEYKAAWAKADAPMSTDML